jgi:septal ring factor EnvC (AmiA/AmiB activator)
MLSRARNRAPFNGKIISPKTTRWSNKIDNVKAKIDNVKAKIDNMKAKIDNVQAKIDNVKEKIQDKEEKEPWSRPTLARRLGFGQLAASPTSFPLEESLRLARQVSALHEKFPPHTRSLHLAREVTATHEKSSSDWCVGPDA